MSIKSRCPVCRKPGVHEFRPFCSRGCRDRDLVNWLDEGYRLPVRPDEGEDGKAGGQGNGQGDGQDA